MTRAEQAEQTRDLLLETAKRLFAENGYDATSLQNIADAAGVTKAALYYYFPTKSELLRAAAAPAIADVQALHEAALAQPSLHGRVVALADGVVEILITHRDAVTLAYNDPAIRRAAQEQLTEIAAAKPDPAEIYGRELTTDERVAHAVLGALPAALDELRDIDDAELRPALRRVALRLLRARTTR